MHTPDLLKIGLRANSVGGWRAIFDFAVGQDIHHQHPAGYGCKMLADRRKDPPARAMSAKLSELFQRDDHIDLAVCVAVVLSFHVAQQTAFDAHTRRFMRRFREAAASSVQT